MRQRPSTPNTQYEATTKKPKVSDGYPQRIAMWEAVKRLGTATRSELFRELQRDGYTRPKGAKMDENYCRIELTRMTKDGFLKRLN